MTDWTGEAQRHRLRQGAGQRPTRLALLLFLTVAAVIGGWARLYHLGSRPLAVDEYYFLRSILSILDSGVPSLPAGGIYVRGWFLQYVTAGAIALSGDPILGLRLVPAVTGLGACTLILVLARRHVGLSLAAVLTVLFLLSSWQIEFSRFGRMYSGLQLVTLAFVILYDRALRRGDRWSFYGCHIVALLGLGTHQTALFFIPLLLPLTLGVDAGRPSGGIVTRRRLAATTLVALVGAVLFFVPFRVLGVVDPLPPGYEAPAISGFVIPDLSGAGGGLWAIMALLLAAAALIFRLRTPKAREVVHEELRASSWGETLVASVLVASAVLHQYLPAGLAAVVLIVRYRVLSRSRRATGRIALVMAALVTVFWLAAFALAVIFGAGMLPPEAGSILGAARRFFFGWPDLYTTLANPWRRDLPLLGAVLALAVTWRTIRALRWRLPRLLREPALLVAYFLLLAGLVSAPYPTVRYTYFVYPLALLALAQTLRDASIAVLGRERRRTASAVAAVLLAVVFASSRDFNPRHVLSVTEVEPSFRIGEWEGYGNIWYGRDDFRSPAEYLSRAADPDEPIVVVHQLPLSYYLDRPHVHFIPRDRVASVYSIVSRDRGTVELWSRQPLAGTLAELYALVGDADTVWIVDMIPQSPETRAFTEGGGWSTTQELRSVDGRIQVMRLTRSGSPGAGSAPVR